MRRMKRYEPAPKWNGRKWRAAVDVFDDRPGKRGKRTIKGNASFETRDEALKQVEHISKEVLTNPVIEESRFEIVE